jgi:hypothetical protein
MSTLTVVTFEPDTIGVYIDGEKYNSGHTYMEARIMRDIMVDDDVNVTETESKHVHPETWRGMPATLEELDEMYETE